MCEIRRTILPTTWRKYVSIIIPSPILRILAGIVERKHAILKPFFTSCDHIFGAFHSCFPNNVKRFSTPSPEITYTLEAQIKGETKLPSTRETEFLRLCLFSFSNFFVICHSIDNREMMANSRWHWQMTRQAFIFLLRVRAHWMSANEMKKLYSYIW